jgi:hypothetical protein
MRGRSWRRYKMEVIVKRRLKKFHSNSYYRFKNVNGDAISSHLWIDDIGGKDSYFYRSHTTSKWDSRNSAKYSPNKTNSYYRDTKKKGESTGIREKDKIIFLKILKENGLRCYNTKKW